MLPSPFPLLASSKLPLKPLHFQASILMHGFTTTSKSKPSLQSIIRSHRSSRCTKLGGGFRGGSQFEGSLMSFFLLSHPYNIPTTRPVIANLGLQSCFHELGATPSEGSAGCEQFFSRFWEDLGFLADFCGGEGCFWCRKLCGFLISCGV